MHIHTCLLRETVTWSTYGGTGLAMSGCLAGQEEIGSEKEGAHEC
jgi:hypothetical protein